MCRVDVILTGQRFNSLRTSHWVSYIKHIRLNKIQERENENNLTKTKLPEFSTFLECASLEQ